MRMPPCCSRRLPSAAELSAFHETFALLALLTALAVAAALRMREPAHGRAGAAAQQVFFTPPSPAQ